MQETDQPDSPPGGEAMAEGCRGASSSRPQGEVEERVLVFTPTGRDGRLTSEILGEAGYGCALCGSMQGLGEEIERGAGVVLLAEEALLHPSLDALYDRLDRQPPWSDLPLIVFSQVGAPADLILERLGASGNVTILERPVRIASLVSAVRTALRARRRQYEVRDLLQRLGESSRRKDEFLAMLGHELRNPLAAVRTALALLAGSGAENERVDRQHAVIDRQTQNLTRIVDDLLEVSRVTLGKISLQTEVLDLRAVADCAVHSLAAAAEERRHTVAFEAGELPVPVEGDPVRLEQVVCNLLHNAIKYTPPGGHIWVSVGVEECGSVGVWERGSVGEKERRGDAGTQRHGGPNPRTPEHLNTPPHAVLRVRDDGAGIPPDMLSGIFELFTQAQTSIDRASGGLGLGLTLVRNLVELHGGVVEAASEGPGRGSEFTVRLPMRMPSVECRMSNEPDSVSRASAPRSLIRHSEIDIRTSKRVLVVEDNVDGRETLRDLLESWGFQVEVAGDGPRGLEKALEECPEVALIDIGLPGLDGYQLARQLRERLNGQTPRLIAMTGYCQPEDRHRALEAGFDAHLVKPLDFDELSRLLAAPEAI